MSDDLFFSGEERPETLLYTGTEEREEIKNDFNRILIIFTALISAVNQTSLKTKKDEDPSSSFYLQHLTD
ncbi:hypothetical protein VAH11_002118 [Morganella morganii]|nr:hypothetical protein [Morganella morganii]